MEDEVNQDNASAGQSLEIIAPNQKDDMKLNSVFLIGGPAPTNHQNVAKSFAFIPCTFLEPMHLELIEK